MATPARLQTRYAESTSAAWPFGALSTKDRFEVHADTRSIPMIIRNADFAAIRILALKDHNQPKADLQNRVCNVREANKSVHSHLPLQYPQPARPGIFG